MLTDSAGNDVSIDMDWAGTAMANAARDPIWQAKVESEVNRNPQIQSVIEQKCMRCHTGMAYYQSKTDGTAQALLGPNGFFGQSHALHEAAMDGVSCTLCHQIRKPSAGQKWEDLHTGNYAVDTSTTSPARIIYGQYSAPMTGPMKMHSGFTPAYGSQAADSGLCAPCHTLQTPIVDGTGKVTGKEFPEQMTYPEWKNSAYATSKVPQTCQICHMPSANGSVKISMMPMMLTARKPFGKHFFVGGNVMLNEMLMEHSTDLGVAATMEQLDMTMMRTLANLESETASLDVVKSSLSAGTLSFDLQVANLAGHKFPSGIPCRRAWLHVKVAAKDGKVVFESGKPLADGSVSGNDADVSTTKHEPHYDVITTAAQVQIYEPVMLNTDNAITWTWLRAASYVKDNRLLPLGFNKATTNASIKVKGSAATDADFIGGSDVVTYKIAVGTGPGPYTVTAELLYQPVSFPFIRDIKVETTPLVKRLVDYWAGTDKTPVTVAALQADIL